MGLNGRKVWDDGSAELEGAGDSPVSQCYASDDDARVALDSGNWTVDPALPLDNRRVHADRGSRIGSGVCGPSFCEE